MKKLFYLLPLFVVALLFSCSSDNSQLDPSKLSKEDLEKLVYNGYEIDDDVNLSIDLSEKKITDQFLMELELLLAKSIIACPDTSKISIKNMKQIENPFKAKFLSTDITAKGRELRFIYFYDEEGTSKCVMLDKKATDEFEEKNLATDSVGNAIPKESQDALMAVISVAGGSADNFLSGATVTQEGKKYHFFGLYNRVAGGKDE